MDRLLQQTTSGYTSAIPSLYRTRPPVRRIALVLFALRRDRAALVSRGHASGPRSASPGDARRMASRTVLVAGSQRYMHLSTAAPADGIRALDLRSRGGAVEAGGGASENPSNSAVR